VMINNKTERIKFRLIRTKFLTFNLRSIIFINESIDPCVET